MTNWTIRRDQMIQRAVLEYLEDRLLFAADGGQLSGHGAACPCCACCGGDGNMFVRPPAQYINPVNVGVSQADLAQAGSPLSSLPQLSSNSGAHAKLYLDFNGSVAQNWGGFNVSTTRAFTLDSDATTYSQSESDAITQIWRRVAEKFSPFNLDVTTIDPGTYTDGNALRVMIGGNGSWYGAGAGGVGYVSSFSSYGTFDLNTVYVFSDLYGANYKGIAEASAHEAGHAFGLQHQSSYSGTTKTAEYNQGTSAVAPIMGVSYYATRGLWSNGPNSYGSNMLQDDMSILSGAGNGFGYRADDHGGTAGAATALNRSGSNVSGSGTIERTTDADYFSFSTGGGSVSFTLSVATYGAMLDAKIVLTNVSGGVILTTDTAALGETFSTTLAAGDYRVGVLSDGNYGDVGQYTLVGNVPPPNVPTPPSGLQTTSTPGGAVSLTWSDQSNNETGFRVDRSTNGGATWQTIYTTSAGATQYTDETAAAGGAYQYRIAAVNSGGASGVSNASAITLRPASPTGLTSVVSGQSVTLYWVDGNGETGYRIERSLDGVDDWLVLATTSANVVNFTDSNLALDTGYFYRLVAMNAAGASEESDVEFAVTDDTVDSDPDSDDDDGFDDDSEVDTGGDDDDDEDFGGVDDDEDSDLVAEPTDLTVKTKKKTAVIKWVDNSNNETGFRVERSVDGGETWGVIKRVKRNKHSVSDKKIVAGSTYLYRAVAVDATLDEESASDAAALTLAPKGSNVTAHAFAGGVQVRWNDVNGETSYQVERTGGGSRAWALVGEVGEDETSFVDETVGNAKYKYRVRAVNAGGSAVSKKSAKVKVAESIFAPRDHGGLSAPVFVAQARFTSSIFADSSDDLLGTPQDRAA